MFTRVSLLIVLLLSLTSTACTTIVDECSQTTFPGLWSGHMYLNYDGLGYASINSSMQLDVESDGETVFGWLYYTAGTYEITTDLIPVPTSGPAGL